MELEINAKEFEEIRALVKVRTGISLSDSKQQLVKSRLQKRLRILGLTSFREYYKILDEQGASGEETIHFINCITTNKTDFFREPHHFEFVRTTLIPRWLQEAKLNGRRKFRIWHAGCSTGEEPYSMAMVLHDAVGGLGWDIKLLATDIDTNVLAHAERGIYDLERVDPVPNQLRRKYLLRGTGNNQDSVKVRSEVRDLIAFRRLNLLSDPWPIRSEAQFDIIFCRNVVIYFDKPTQRVLFKRFAHHLRDGGHLIVGHSENLLGVTDDFLSLGGTIHSYERPRQEAA